jgi:H+/gluconate symporter-like permease
MALASGSVAMGIALGAPAAAAMAQYGAVLPGLLIANLPDEDDEDDEDEDEE